MAKVDWINGVWYAYQDPTGVLEPLGSPDNPKATGIVLRLRAPDGKEWSDALAYEIGSNPQVVWNHTDYSASYKYAWVANSNADAKPMPADEYYIYVRATGSTQVASNYKFQNAYRGRMVVGTTTADNALVYLERINSGTVTQLATTTITDASGRVLSKGSAHTYQLDVSGGSQNVSLTLKVDGETLLNHTDSNAASLTTGAPGFGIKNGGGLNGGAVWADYFETNRLEAPKGDESWVPSSIAGLVGWYKGNMGVTKDGANKVSNWNDISGNDNNTSQSISTKQPIYTASEAKYLPGIVFDGTDDFVAASDAATLDLTSGVSIFAVAKVSTFGGSQPVVTKGVTPNYAFGLSGGIGANAGEVYFQSGNTTITGQQTTWTEDVYHIASIVSADSNGNGILAVDGATDDQTAVNLIPGSANNNDLTIGGDGTSEWLNGGVTELLIFNSQLSAANRQKVEGYLAWRYGLQGNLPATHPYKAAAPTA